MAGNFDNWKTRTDREGEEPEPERELEPAGPVTGIEWLQEALHAIRNERVADDKSLLDEPIFAPGLRRAEAVIEGLIEAYQNG